MIIPAIDLLDGRVVRLRQGQFSNVSRYSDDPEAVAEKFAATGVEWLHVVDLSGARNPASRQTDLICKIISSTKCRVQVGGGVRTLEDVRGLIKVGVARVVIGSKAILDTDWAVSCIQEFGSGSIVAAIDVVDRGGVYRPAINGWQDVVSESADVIVERLVAAGLGCMMMTDIGRDGMMSGPNTSLYAEVLEQHSGISMIASGGVRSIEDIEALKRVGVAGVVAGRAILEGTLLIEEALECWRKG